MKKILFAILATVAITSVSCTSDALEQNTTSKNAVKNNSEIIQNQKYADTTGGQGGQVPPPMPK